jgi:prophage regulatory protein
MTRILRQRQVCEKVGYSTMHIYRLEKAGKFPRRVRLGPNSVGFVAEEVDAWIEARIAERDEAMEREEKAPK